MQHWQLYVFLLLPIAYIIIFHYIPLIDVQIAFRKYTPKGGVWGSTWVGFANFEKFFSSYMFGRVLKNTLTISLYGLLANMPVAIIFALLINTMRNQRIKKAVQTITYIPYFISTVVLVSIIQQIANPQTGLYGTLSTMLLGRTGSVDLMASGKAYPHVFVWSAVWQKFGWNSVVYIAALTSVSPEIHEAAEIDGASRFKRLIYIDFPEILPTATIMLILGAGQIMSLGFEKAYLMQNNLNKSASEIISTYVYTTAFKSTYTDFSYSTAIGLFNSVINLVLLSGVNAVAKRMGSTSLW